MRLDPILLGVKGIRSDPIAAAGLIYLAIKDYFTPSHLLLHWLISSSPSTHDEGLPVVTIDNIFHESCLYPKGLSFMTPKIDFVRNVHTCYKGKTFTGGCGHILHPKVHLVGHLFNSDLLITTYIVIITDFICNLKLGKKSVMIHL